MPISSKELAEQAGISWAYAIQLLSDNPDQHREPSLKMALHIYDKTGERLGILKDMEPAEIEPLRRAAA